MSAQMIRLAFRSQLFRKACRIASIFGLLALSAAAADAATFVTNTAQSTGNWNQSIWTSSTAGSGTLAPTSSGDYVALSGALLRSTSVSSFLGHSLTLNAGSSIRFKLSTVSAAFGTTSDLTSGLILSGGTVDPGDSATFGITGVVTVKANSFVDMGNTVGGTNNTADGRGIDFEALIQGGNKISLVNNQNNSTSVFMTVGNNGGTVTSTFSGTWDIQSYGLTTKGTNVLGMVGGLGASTVNLSTTAAFNMTAASNSQAIAALTSNTVGAGTVNLGTGNILTINGSGNNGFSGLIQGAGGLTLNRPSGTFFLSGTGTYSGGTTITSGSLELGSLNAAQSSTVTLNAPANGLIFASGIPTFNVGGLTGTGSLALTNTAGTAITLQVGGNGASSQYPGTLSGGGGLTTAGGTFTLSGTNLYTGGTVVSGGVLDATTTAALPSYSSGTASVASGGVLAVQVLAGSAANGWTDASIASLEANSNLTIAAGGALGIDVVGGASYTPSISFVVGAGGNGVTKIGAGTLIFASSDSYTGSTTISAGTLQIGNGGSGLAAGSLSTSSAIIDNAALVFNRSDTVTQGTDFNGAGISGTGALKQAGGGTLVLNTTNTYSGATTVNSGTLDLQNQFALQNSTFAGGAGTLTLDSVVAAHAFNFGGLSGTSNLPLLDNAANPIALSVGNNGQGATYSGMLSGGGSLLKVGAGTQVLNGGNSYIGTTTIATGTLQIGSGGSGLAAGSLSTSSVITDNGTLAFNRSDTVTQGTDFSGAAVTGSGGITQLGSGTLVLNATNTYSGVTSVANGTMIVNGPNTGTVSYSATNGIPSGLTVLSLRNSLALGAGTANSTLAPISLNATGGSNASSIIDTTILEIGSKFGTDPGGNNADFSYQVVAPLLTNAVTPTQGQISLGSLSNNDDGVGFAAYNSGSLSTPRIVALYSSTATTTLVTLQEKTHFGQGSGDHLTLGSPTANNTLVLLNSVDLNGGASRQFASIRGVGIVPEGEYAGAIIDTSSTNINVSFNGNGGLIFDSAATSYLPATLQVNNGAAFVAANDPAQVGVNGALGQGTATIQIGTSTTVNPAGGTAIPTLASAHIAFMTYGGNNGIGSLSLATSRNIAVGGSGVVYASAVLGGMTDDWTAMNGNIALNEAPATPTTFTARNGGRVDFGGVISGSGAVVVGNSTVEGDATAAGITLSNNGSIVFKNANTYTGATSITAGKLYVNGSIAALSSVAVGSGATLGGQGTVNGPVTVASGGFLEAGQGGVGVLTLNGSAVTFNGPATINFFGLGAPGNPGLVINGTNILNTNGNTVTLGIASLAGTGTYALIGYNGVQTSASNTFTLGTLPNRGVGGLVLNGNELDLSVTSLASIYWTGSTSTSWDTTSTNWLQQGFGPTQYIDSPGDTVIFDDSAAPNTAVSINGADVHPTSVTFNNNSSIYTISGTNAIAGTTGVSLTGTGTVVLLNSNTYTGVTSIGAGATLQLGNGTPGSDGSISQTISISDSGALNYNLAGAQAYEGVISGPGTLTVQSGLLSLTGSSTYTGGTTISGGTLQLGTGAVNKDGSLAGNLADNGVLAFNYHGNQSFAGAISGSGAVTKTGPGTVTLGSANTFTGGLALNLGGVQLGNSAAIQNSTVTMGANTSLTFASGIGSFGIGGLAGNAGSVVLQDSAAQPVALSVGSNGQNTTFSGVISAAGSLTMVGSGTLTLGNSNSFSGNTLISNGTIALGNSLALQNSTLDTSGTGALSFGTLSAATLGGLTGGGNVVLNNTTPAGVALSVGNNNSTTTYSGALSGSGSLAKIGAGALTITGVNTYGGSTSITGGSLDVANPLSLSNYATGTVSVGGSATLDLLAQTTNAPNGWSGANLASLLTNPSATFTSGAALGLDVAAGDTFSTPTNSVFAGAGNKFIKLDGGTLIVTASNTYTGSTTIAGGTLQLGNGTAGNDGSIATSSNIVNNGALVYNLVGNRTYSGVISGNGSLATLGTALLALTGTNTYSGNTTIGGGTLSIGSDVNLGAVPTTVNPTSIVMNGGVLQITAGSAFNTSTLSTSRGITLNAPVATVNLTLLTTGTFSTNEVAVQYRGVITGTGGLLVTGGAGTNSGTTPYVFELGGQNTYGGSTTVNNAIISFNNGNNGGAGPANILPTTTVLNLINNGWFDMNNGTANQSISGLSGDSTAKFATTNTGQANLTITPSSGSTYTFAGVIGAQTILGKVGGNANFTLTLNGAGGTEILTGSNTYAAATTITAGTLQLGNGGSTGSLAASGTAIVDNGTLAFNRSNTVTQGADFASVGITGGGGLLQLGTGDLILTAANGYNGATTITAGTLQLGNGGATGSLSTSSLITDNGALDFDRSNTVTQGADFSGAGITGGGTVIQSGGGMLVLNASNGYSGGTFVSSGTLQLGNANALGTGGLTANGGVVDLNANALINGTNALPSLSGIAGTITDNSANGSTILAVNQASNTTFGGNIQSGALGTGIVLQKFGAGSLTLGGNNAVAGASVNNTGTLQIAGSLTSNGEFDVNNGSQVAGSGSLVLGSSAGMVYSSSAASTFGGAISGIGPVTLNNGSITLSGPNSYQGGSLINSGTATFTVASALPSAGNLVIGSGGDVILGTGGSGSPSPAGTPSLAPVPEPGTFGLLAIAALFGLYLRKKRK